MIVPQNFLLKLAVSKLPVHIFFCAVFIALCFVPVIASPFRSELLPRAAFVCLFFLGTAYSGRWACKAFLLKGRITVFITVVVVLIIGISLLFSFFLFISELNRGWSSLTFGVPLVVLFFTLGLFLTTARDSLFKQLVAADIADRQKQSELELLRSQLSPHFLFNTLNNIYGLAIKKDQQIALLIVKLSDLLRYSLSDAGKRFVHVQEEINYINNYIELEKIRLGDRLQLTTNLNDEIADKVKIPPMLLIVFVENAFKHSKNTYGNHVRIDITASAKDDKFLFSISNSCGEMIPSHHHVPPVLGMGFSNTIRRLDLLYGDQYSLKHFTQQDNYFVYLELPKLNDGTN